MPVATIAAAPATLRTPCSTPPPESLSRAIVPPATVSSAFCLPRYTLGCRADLLRAAQVALLDRYMGRRLEILVELVDEGLARRDVQLDDVGVADVVKVLHERPQAVAVGTHEDGVPGPQVRHDRVVPVREQPGDDVGQALRQRQRPCRDLRVRSSSLGLYSFSGLIGGGGTS